MNNMLSYSQPSFGNIYSAALEAQLQNIGHSLSAIRKGRNENLESVANAVNLLPVELESIENGQYDFRLKMLFDLCHYYETPLEEVVQQSGLMQLKIA